MERLSVLLERLRHGRDAGLTQVWTGPALGTPEAIAGQLGYVPVADALHPIEREEAAGLLAWLSRESVAYGSDHIPPPEVVTTVLEALEVLGPDARFWTNGDWAERWRGSLSAGWAPLSDATFDVGVIACDADHAFIFWVEEED